MLGLAAINYRVRWDTATAFVVLCILAVITAIRILGKALFEDATEMYRAAGYEAMINPKREPVTVNVPDLNPKFGLTSRTVQIDVERAFARVLMEFPNDMTEKTWIKRGRWQQIGGGGPEQFRNILHKWESAGIVSKRNPNVKNSAYFVSRKSALAQIAGGRLPSPSRESGQK
jgi:hypothetical protein